MFQHVARLYCNGLEDAPNQKRIVECMNLQCGRGRSKEKKTGCGGVESEKVGALLVKWCLALMKRAIDFSNSRSVSSSGIMER